MPKSQKSSMLTVDNKYDYFLANEASKSGLHKRCSRDLFRKQYDLIRVWSYFFVSKSGQT